MPSADFAELHARVKAASLLDKQPGYMLFKIATTVLLYIAGFAALFFIDNIWLVLLDAAFLGFVFVQVGFLGHDVGHRQSFSSKKASIVASIFTGNLLLGASAGWWVSKHDAHHASPNREGADPDIEIPVLAFSEEQAIAKKGAARHIVRHQAWYFVPLLMIAGFLLPYRAYEYLRKRPARWQVESALIVLHFVAYFAIIFTALPVGWGILFILAHNALFGIYLNSVFAPNHKGMPIIKKGEEIDFVREQVITARNVRAHPIIDFWYGGLNYQIEHHLFPNMPRNKLRQAQTLVRAFCEEKGIEYYETSMARSYVEIISHLHEVSKPLRNKRAA